MNAANLQRIRWFFALAILAAAGSVAGTLVASRLRERSVYVSLSQWRAYDMSRIGTEWAFRYGKLPVAREAVDAWVDTLERCRTETGYPCRGYPLITAYLMQEALRREEVNENVRHDALDMALTECNAKVGHDCTSVALDAGVERLRAIRARAIN